MNTLATVTRERPALFNSPMVQALLARRKRQTRRICKPRRDLGTGCMLAPNELAGEVNQLRDYSNSPYGKPGEHLWVRESWQGPLIDSNTYEGLDGNCKAFESPEFCRYAADGGPRPEYMDADDKLRYGWKPGIHMFRWASRILLSITAVRIERLQDISEADALAEGIIQLKDGGYGLPDGSHYHASSARMSYWSLWDAINGAGSVDTNPWVWVISFEVVKP